MNESFMVSTFLDFLLFVLIKNPKVKKFLNILIALNDLFQREYESFIGTILEAIVETDWLKSVIQT